MDADFEAEVRALLADGQKIEAVKRCRERYGLGLKEAKEAVEAVEQGGTLPQVSPGNQTLLEAEVLSLLEQGRKIEAVKIYRERMGVGLKEAKDAVEAIARERGLTSSGSGCLGMVLLVMAMCWAVAASQ